MNRRIVVTKKGLMIFVVAATALAIGVTIYARQPRGLKMPQNPQSGAVVATSDLLSTTRRLQTNIASSLGSNQENITKEYISMLERMLTDCKFLDKYASQAAQKDSGSDNAIYLAKSKKLCEELMPIVSESKHLYTAVLPVMGIPTGVRRYQTLPLLKSHLLQKSRETTKAALSQLTDQASEMDFSTQSVELTSNLYKTMKTSNSFGYTKDLASYKIALLAERQRFWSSYADIDSLERVLGIQLGKYCRDLNISDSKTYKTPCQETER